MKLLEAVLRLRLGTRKWIAPGLGEHTGAMRAERSHTPTDTAETHQIGAV